MVYQSTNNNADKYVPTFTKTVRLFIVGITKTIKVLIELVFLFREFLSSISLKEEHFENFRQKAREGNTLYQGLIKVCKGKPQYLQISQKIVFVILSLLIVLPLISLVIWLLGSTTCSIIAIVSFLILLVATVTIVGIILWAMSLSIPEFQHVLLQIKNVNSFEEFPISQDEGVYIGEFNGEYDNGIIRYDGENHLITFAAAGSGKGASSIIPNLLTYPGSILIIDPKGENALNSIGIRKQAFDHSCHVLDPFDKTKLCNKASSNPLDFLIKNPDLAITESGFLADALIIPAEKDPHWTDSAKMLLQAAILHVSLSDEYDNTERHLPMVHQEILGNVQGFIKEMKNSRNSFVQKVAEGFDNTPEKELGSIVSTCRSNLGTIFSDPILSETMKWSSFDVADLSNNKTSIYLVLPIEKLQQFSRWLRIVVAISIKSLLASEIKPTPPALFILDEFAHLGRLDAIKSAMGMVRSSGVKIWPFLQDLNQLKENYPQGWGTFLANAGITEIFGINDYETAKYFSDMLGHTKHICDHRKGRINEGLLRNPEDIMKFYGNDQNLKLVFRQGKKAIEVDKVMYYKQGSPFYETWQKSLKLLEKNL